jgi:hypothetical protein
MNVGIKQDPTENRENDNVTESTCDSESFRMNRTESSVSLSVANEIAGDRQLCEIAGSTGCEAGTSVQAVAAAATFAVSSAGASSSEDTFQSCGDLGSIVLSDPELYCTAGNNVMRHKIDSVEMSWLEQTEHSGGGDKALWESTCELECANDTSSDAVNKVTADEELYCAQVQLNVITEATANVKPVRTRDTELATEVKATTVLNANHLAFCLSSIPSTLDHEFVHTTRPIVQQQFDPGGELMTSSKQFACKTASNNWQGSKLQTSLSMTETKQHEHRSILIWSLTEVMSLYADYGGSQPSGRSKGRPTSPDPGGGITLLHRSVHIITTNIFCILVLVLYVLHLQCTYCLAIKFAGTRIPPGGSRVTGARNVFRQYYPSLPA